MSEQTNIQKLNEELSPFLDKALEMGVILTVLSVNIKPVAGQEYFTGGISTYLEKDELITMLENTIKGLKANQ